MPAPAFIVNRALQTFGSRTTVTDAELASNSTNEAIQANLIADQLRLELLRMAPWDCAFNYTNLTLIASAPGTPENTSPALPLWMKGQPPPPWVYEYCYPVDCARACWIVPQTQTGFMANFVPLSTGIVSGPAPGWQGPPIKFKVSTDQFWSATAVSVASGGSGYVAGDVVMLAVTAPGSPSIGASAQVTVLTVDGNGAVLTCELSTSFRGGGHLGGSYFGQQPNPIPNGLLLTNKFTRLPVCGSDALFNLSSWVSSDQRVILTNQEFAMLAYVSDITDTAVMDPLFTDAWINILGARLIMALAGDKSLANMGIGRANEAVVEARKADANEGLTINDITPDWIRTRGIAFSDYLLTGPYSSFNWGNMFPIYG